MISRRGLFIGAASVAGAAIAAPSIIGISGRIQLSVRPALVVPLDTLRLALVLGWQQEIIEAWQDAAIFGRGAILVDADGVRCVDPFGPDAEKALRLEFAPSGVRLLPQPSAD